MGKLIGMMRSKRESRTLSEECSWQCVPYDAKLAILDLFNGAVLCAAHIGKLGLTWVLVDAFMSHPGKVGRAWVLMRAMVDEGELVRRCGGG